MEIGTLTAIISTGAGLFGGIVSTAAISFYRIGRATQRVDDAEEKIKVLTESMDVCRSGHSVTEKEMNDRIYSGLREISTVSTATDKLEAWFERIEAKLDRLIEDTSNRRNGGK